MPIQSYEDRKRQSQGLKMTGAVAGAAALFSARRRLTGYALQGAEWFSRRTVGNMLESSLGSSVGAIASRQQFRPAARMAIELKKHITRVAGRERQSHAAGLLLYESSRDTEKFLLGGGDVGASDFIDAFGGRDLFLNAVGLGQRRSQFAYDRAFRSRGLRKNLPDQLEQFYKPLAGRSQFSEIVEFRTARLKESGLAAAAAQNQAKEELAKALLQVNNRAGQRMATGVFDGVAVHQRLQSNQRALFEGFRRYLKDIREEEFGGNPAGKVTRGILDSLGIKKRTLGDDSSFALAEEIFTAPRTGLLGRLGINDPKEQQKFLKEFASSPTSLLIRHEGRDYDLSALPTAVSKVYNQLREAIQLPVNPGLGGFSLFSFFPQLRGQSHNIFHEIPALAKQPLIQSLLGPEREFGSGSLYIIGRRTSPLRFEGRGLMLGGSAAFEAGEDSLIQAERAAINEKLGANILDVRDAQSGFLRKFASRLARHSELQGMSPEQREVLLPQSWAGKGIDAFMSKMDPTAPEYQILSKIRKMERSANAFFFPGGTEAPSLLDKGLSVWGKYSNPEYLPNIYKSILESETPNSRQIETVISAMQERSGGIAAKDLMRLTQDPTGLFGIDAPGELISLMTGTHGPKNARNLTNDHHIIGFFSNHDINLNHIRSPQLKRAMEAFRNSPESSMGHGRSDYVDSILDEAGFTVRGVFGEAEKPQGMARLRELLVAELALQNPQGDNIIARVARDGSLSSKQRGLYSAFLQGHKLGFELENSGIDEVYKSFRGPDSSVRDSVKSLLDNRYKFTDTFVDTDERSLGSRWVVMRTPKDMSEGSNAAQLVESIMAEGQVFLSAGISKTQRLDAAKRAWGALKDSDLMSPAISFFKGFDAPEHFDGRSLTPYFLTTRLNEFLTPFGLGLGQDDLTSAWRTLSAIAVKRLLPGYVGMRAIDYMDFEADNFGVVGPSEGLANIRANASLIGAGIGDFTGATDFKKRLKQLLPGSEEFFGFRPMSHSELQDYLDHGYDPVRKGRGWLFGSRTPIAGDSVDYFEASYLQRAASHWDSKAGGPKSADSFKYSLLPSLRYPLAPLRALLDPYGREREFSEGRFAPRPYPLSGPLIDPNISGAGLINNTIGLLIKPQKELNTGWARGEVESLNRNRIGFGPGGIGLGGRASGGGGGFGIGGGGLGPGSGMGWGNGLSASDRPASIVVVGEGGTMEPEALPGGFVPEPYMGVYAGKAEEGKSLSKKQVARLNRKMRDMGTGLTRLPRSSKERRTDGYNEIIDPRSLDNQAQMGLYQGQQVAGIYGYFMSFFSGGVLDFGSPPHQRILADSSAAFGVEGRFWEADRGGTFLGPMGLGLDQPLNEFIRRIIPHKRRTLEPYNPIPNQFFGSDWLPTDETYFIDFQRGDPYTKVKRGLTRLPGEAYRALHRNEILNLRASSAGKSAEEMAAGMMGIKEPMSEYGESVTSLGTELHAKVEHALADQGIAVAREVTLSDKKLGIQGHLDAVIKTARGLEITDLKTVGEEKFNAIVKSGKALEEHMRQIAVYQHMTGIKKGRVLYASRDSGRVIDMVSDYSELRFQRVMGNLSKARSIVLEKLKNREISEAELYDDVTKYEILSDVAPYSLERRALENSFAYNDQLSEEDKAKIKAAKKRAAIARTNSETFEYRFQGIGNRLKSGYFMVDRIAGPDSIYVRGSDRPIKLAGGTLTSANIRAYLQEKGIVPDDEETPTEAFYESFGIYPGKVLRGLYDKDQSAGTLKVAVGSLTRKFIDLGVMTEDPDDFSPAAVQARFSATERFMGSMFEGVAHLDNLVNTKLWRVRSPLEAYKREIVYGTKEGSWDKPFSTYVWPTLSAITSKDPLSAGLLGGFVSTTPFVLSKHKKMAAIIGAGAGVTLSVGRSAYELFTGKKFMPSGVARRREVEEYFDILTYVKERSLFEKKADLALKEEGTDIRRIISRFENLAEYRKKNRYREDENQQLATLALGPIATQALQHRNRYRKTMYGAQPGGPLMEVLGTMPKHERDILTAAMNSSKRDKAELYELLSDPQKRLLGIYLGKSERVLPKRPELNEYFRSHQLPEEGSPIWDEDVALEDLKIRAYDHEGFRKIELGLFPQVVEQAKMRTQDIDVPYPEGRTIRIKQKLNKILSGQMRQQYRTEMRYETPSWADAPEFEVEMNVKQNRRRDLHNALNEKY